MSTTITIDGASVSLDRYHVPRRLHRPLGGVDTYTFEYRWGALPVTDPLVGKEITVTISGTLRFTGDIERVQHQYRDGTAWVRSYQCLGLRARGDWVGHRDSNNGSDSSSYNVPRDTAFTDWLPARAGRTAGEILEDVLTSPENAAALDALGIGGYTSLSPPTLPTATANDLAAMDWILPGPIRVGGEKLLTSIESTASVIAPNHRMVVEPTGVIRFYDTTAFSNVTHTLGANAPPPSLSRDTAECFTAVEVRGQGLAMPYAFSLAEGTLDEDEFAYDGLTVAQAKGAFKPEHFYSPDSVDQGTCVCNTTTTVTVTSSDASVSWSADFWNQSAGKRYGIILLTKSGGTTITTHDSRLVIDSNALTAGGSALLTLDRALPNTDFNRYMLRGRRGGKQNVWSVYGLPSWAGPKVAPISAFPFPFKHAGGGGVIMTSTAMGLVQWSASGNPPYREVGIPIEVDADAGVVVFPTPTYIMAGNRRPTNVIAIVPIYNDVNLIRKPASGFEGVAYDDDGREKVLSVFVPTWRDPANRAGMEAYAQQLLDSVKDPIIEGNVAYHALSSTYLGHGNALVIESPDMATTPWEATPLPVRDIQLDWGTSPSDPTLWTITMGVSTRRAHFTDAAFMHPDRTGVTLDFGNAMPMDLSFMAGNSGSVTGPTLGGLFGLHNNMLSGRNATAAGIVGGLDAGVMGTLAGIHSGAVGAYQGAYAGAAAASDSAASAAASAMDFGAAGGGGLLDQQAEVERLRREGKL